MEATDRESEAPILKSGMKRFFKRCWRTGITAECLSVLWFSQQLLIRLTSHVVGVLLRTRGSAESRASSWDQSAAALHPPDVHVMSTGLLVCCWSRWMCSETAAARSFAIFPPDKTQTHHLSPAAPHIFPWRAERKNLLCYRTKQFCGEMPSEGEPLICFIDRLVVPRCSWSQCYSHQGCFGRTGPVWSRHHQPRQPLQLTPQTGSEVQWRNDLYFYSFKWLGNSLVPELNTLMTSDRKCELRCKIYI